MGAASRALFLPLLPLLAAGLLVYAATHPTPREATGDPAAYGIYFQSISITTEDGLHLNSWLLPAIDAHRVLAERDSVLKDRWPAIILVHDFTQSLQDMLPLVGPLHDEGFVLLVISLRGDGANSDVCANLWPERGSRRRGRHARHPSPAVR